MQTEMRDHKFKIDASILPKEVASIANLRDFIPELCLAVFEVKKHGNES